MSIRTLRTGTLQNAILSSADFSIIATDATGIIQLFNPGAERMLGYASADVIDKKTPSDIYDPEEIAARARALSLEFGTAIKPGFDALACKASRGIDDIHESTFIRGDGSQFPATVSVTALRDDYGYIIGYLLVGADNTARKRVEMELQKARAAADEASQAKSAFLSSMSHELRTPLNAILGFAQVLETSSPLPTPAQQRSIGQVLKAGWYLLDLINEILDLTLIESGNLLLSVESVLLAEVLRECHSMVEGEASKCDIRLIFPSFDTTHFVKVDRTRFKQAVVNLLTNAIKYNRAGGTVIVACIVTTHGRIRISIEDTGEGLREEQIAQLFQPFNRLGQEAGGPEGTGIGLVTTKRLIELMDGQIGVESTVGRGSVFWVELPLTGDRQHVIGATDSQFVTHMPSDDGAIMRTVLYVEDNPANLMLVEELIERQPHVCLLSATDGSHGIEIARDSLPDMILMDINLPGISGIQALKILREDPATAHIPVVALTGNAIPRDIKKGLEAGFFRYLTKPINVQDFMKTIDATLKFAETQSASMETQVTRT